MHPEQRLHLAFAGTTVLAVLVGSEGEGATADAAWLALGSVAVLWVLMVVRRHRTPTVVRRATAPLTGAPVVPAPRRPTHRAPRRGPVRVGRRGG